MSLTSVLAKTATTIIAPPVGFALWPEGILPKIKAAGVGLVLSFVASDLMVDYNTTKLDEQTRNWPRMSAPQVSHYPFLTSPVIFYALLGPQETAITQNNVTYTARNPSGTTPIFYQDGKYHLAFDTNTIVRETQTDRENVREIYERKVDELNQKETTSAK